MPMNYMLETLGSRAFQVVFQVMLFGTLVETGAGLIHSVNERIARTYSERDWSLPGEIRVGAALGMLGLGAVIAQFGLISLIAKGYGYITYGYLAVFVVPVLTWGVVLIRRQREGGQSA